MKITNQPDRSQWATLLQRPAQNFRQLEDGVSTIMESVRDGGDATIRELTNRFDGVDVLASKVAVSDLKQEKETLSDELLTAIKVAAENIERFHRSQIQEPVKVATMPGVTCWRKSVGIEKVGLYVPGGTAPLFSTVLMLAIPARLAGCKEIILCSPPGKDGKIHPATLAAADFCGVTEVFTVGGAQAIAAMTYGTGTIPRVDKLFGPGNAYVTVAKQLAVAEGLAIDMPAGPSEVLVCADKNATPAFVAADLLSQAEHGADSQVVLVCFSQQQAEAIVAEVETQLTALPRRKMAAQSIANSLAVVIDNEATATDLINAYAPEHLILSMDDALEFSEGIINAGSVFLGHLTAESMGDYASGTNHTLPTYGYARQYSGVSLDSFVKKITYQQVTRKGLENLGPHVITMARAEGLEAHALAVEKRMSK
ncbi:histidinol dehydrogenase [Lewinellaceae bacterium SD302]|nr:histidinol dehydrogenase [Lewinellaceae bacterium SD302]